MTVEAGLRTGQVVASHGRHCVVEPPGGGHVICHPRGKKNQVVVGDNVLWQASQGEGTIEKVQLRHNLFYRRDEMRVKAFAANLDQVLVQVAAEPVFSEHQLARALIAAEEAQITPVIALNKRDLHASFAVALERLQPYRAMGYTVLELALKQPDAKQDAMLHGLLCGKTTLVLGPSGVGKSTLINCVVPQASALTAEISRALNAGRHTTTTTTLYWVSRAQRSALIDSPGFQEFGLHHVQATQLAQYMPDVAVHATACRFYNCTHMHEPGCAVMAAVANPQAENSISASRYRIYTDLFTERSQARGY